ncbi:unnamed protein product, partial [Mesorhabditis belari]|uniref:Uncharacterized protein n=1 Tax=Mesorhabditis belari TaxID=2138241 RepID=A0AAF3FE80_9BILA
MLRFVIFSLLVSSTLACLGGGGCGGGCGGPPPSPCGGGCGAPPPAPCGGGCGGGGGFPSGGGYPSGGGGGYAAPPIAGPAPGGYALAG